MNWIAKAALFKVLSLMPGGEALYNFGRVHVTRSLVPTRERVDQKLNIGLQYWDWLAQHEFSLAAKGRVHLDFGAGWHPAIPLLFYSLGVERQFLLDARPYLTGPTLTATINAFRSVVENPAWPWRGLLRRLPEPDHSGRLSLTEYLGRMGMTYIAPYHGRFGELAGAVDVITSTAVFYFVPAVRLDGCFQQLHSCLRSGMLLATTHLTDTWVSNIYQHSRQYDHLKYPPAIWEGLANSSLMTFNRLKPPDYRRLLEEAGFKLREFQVARPTAEDLAMLAQLPVHPSFRHYEKEDLGAKHIFFAAQSGADFPR